MGLNGEDLEKLQKLIELIRIQNTTKLEAPLVEFHPMLILVNGSQDLHVIFSIVKTPNLGKVKAVHIYVAAPQLNIQVDKLFSIESIFTLLQHIEEASQTENSTTSKSLGLIFDLAGILDVTIRARVAVDIPPSAFKALESFCHRILKYWDIEERKDFETDDVLLKGETIVISPVEKQSPVSKMIVE